MDKITWKQFKRCLTCQPYYIWTNSSTNNNDDFLDEFDASSFWSETAEVVDTTVTQVIGETFNKLTDKLKSLLLKNGAVVIKSKSVEDRIEETKQYFGSSKIVIGATFEFMGAIASPIAFDFKNGHVIVLKYSSKTKLIDFMEFFYIYSIINEITKINDFDLYLPKNQRGLKGEIDLHLSNEVSSTKTGHRYDEEDKDGNSKLSKIMYLMKYKPTLKRFEEVDGKKEAVHEKIILDFDEYIQIINESRECSSDSINELEKDNTPFGTNPFWNDIMGEFEIDEGKFSGNIWNKSKIIEKVTNENASLDDPKVLEEYKNISKEGKASILSKEIVIMIINRVKKSNRVIWYDFEGYSLPFPAVDYTKPYQQIVNQLSLVETNGKLDELRKDNLVWDPKTMNIDDQYEVLENVYSNGADAYVVYNKGYENTRLKEIVALLEIEKDSRFTKAQQMFNHIDKNTIDLYDLFRITSSKNNLPPILLHDQYCKASIKNIEKHISSNGIVIPYETKEYKNLDIQNGMMAMKEAVKRATNITKDNEWSMIVEDLKEYCENDVRMMIKVFFFIEQLLKENHG